MPQFRVFVLTALVAAVAASAAAQPPSQSPSAPKAAPQQPAAPASAPKAAPQQPAAVPALPAAALRLPTTVCGQAVPAPAKLPPTGSQPVLYSLMLCFEKQGGSSVIDPQTYLYYLQLKDMVSRPSQDRWTPYTDATEQVVIADFKRLWGTNFLDDLSIDVQDIAFANGVVGKLVVYNMEERQRVKIVDYVGSKTVEQSKIDEELKKKGIQIRLDSFIDPATVRRVAGIVHDMYAEKGYQYAEVKPEIKPVEGGTKTVNLSFHISQGPKVKISKVQFLGNKAVSNSALADKMKDNHGKKSFFKLGWLTGTGTYNDSKFADDAEKVVEYYREMGYVRAQVGQPELKIIEDAKDAKTRYIELEIPVTEGQRYRVGEFAFAGNSVIKSEGLRPLFKLDKGDWYNEKKIRKGLDKAREAYGTGGYFEFVGYPDLSFPGEQPANGAPPSDGAAGPPPPSPAAPATADKAAAATAGTADKPAAKPETTIKGAPVVNVTMRMEEGKQYFVHRITFVGNTTTRDNVVRREIRLFEGGVFNTEALKYSVRRINQLGYFKNVEGDAIDVQKTPGADSQVDVKLKLEEQNRNQITFGAGVSQYEGFFGQLAFQTSNFMGRGETFSVSLQQGNRAKNYQVGFTEPFLFDRPITAGIDVFKTSIEYIGQYTQESSGMNTVWGFPAGPFSRIYANYSYQNVHVKDLNPLYTSPAVLQNNPFLADSLLLAQGGTRKISKIGPSYVYNTVDNPIFPTTGRRYSFSFDLAGLGGNTKYYNPKAEAVWYLQQSRRTSFGFRAQWEYIQPYGSGAESVLPIFEKLFLGGEYSVRGYDLRSIGPRDPATQLVIGGNKSLLFNAEYLISIAGPVRLVLFYDAGQVRAEGEHFGWNEPLYRHTTVGGLIPFLGDPYQVVSTLTDPLPSLTEQIGTTSAFKTSTGAEIRFFMPVLNVPFRLIFAMNPQRGGVLDNNLQPEKKFKFRFAVGTTF